MRTRETVRAKRKDYNDSPFPSSVSSLACRVMAKNTFKRMNSPLITQGGSPHSSPASRMVDVQQDSAPPGALEHPDPPH